MNKLHAADMQDKYLVPGLERGLRVLCEVGKGGDCLDAPELARRLDVPRTTVFRLLATLEQMGFVARNESGHKFGLGMSVLRLGFEYLSSLELTQHGRTVLDHLRDRCGHSCHLVVRDGTDIVYVAKAVAVSPLASSVNVGTRLPAHATVLGRVLLQDLGIEELRELYPQHELERRSPHTPMNVDELFALLSQDRNRGYVHQQGFFEPSISTIAAPVRDEMGRVIAALGATVPEARNDGGSLQDLIHSVCDAADELSDLLQGGTDTSRIHHSLNGMTA
jgi:DNA-binding IclR family transcriptional regulator